MSCEPEPTIRSCNTGRREACFAQLSSNYNMDAQNTGKRFWAMVMVLLSYFPRYLIVYGHKHLRMVCRMPPERSSSSVIIRSDKGLKLETSAFQLVMVANLHFQLS